MSGEAREHDNAAAGSTTTNTADQRAEAVEKILTAQEMIARCICPIKVEHRMPRAPRGSEKKQEEKTKPAAEVAAGADQDHKDEEKPKVQDPEGKEGEGKDAEDSGKKRGADDVSGGAADADGGSKRQKNNRGQNKGQRGTHARGNLHFLRDAVPRLCNKISRGFKCNFGEKCIHPHDVAAFKERIVDIPDLSSIPCPNVFPDGGCRYGANCRVGNCRALMVEKLLSEGAGQEDPNLGERGGVGLNLLSRKIQESLREVRGKSKYVWKKVGPVRKSFRAMIDAEKAQNGGGKPGSKGGEKAQEGAKEGAQVGGAAGEKEEEGQGGGGGGGACATVTKVDEGGGGDSTKYDAGVCGVRKEEKKKIDFEGKTVLAPLTTVGNLPFRRICKDFGCDITVGEMAMTKRLLEGSPTEWALFRRHKCEDVYGVQVATQNGEEAGKIAELLENECTVDFFDLNCGCPLDAVCNRGMGAGMMETPGKLREVVTIASRCTTIPMTVKMRIGPKDDKKIAHNLIPRVADWGASAITIHGRSRQARYSRLPDWGYISECSKVACSSGIPLIGNGDVLSWEDFEEHRKGGVSACMLGRGALIKPWVFKEIKEKKYYDIRSSERLELMKTYAGYGLDHWGSDTEGVEKTRSFLLEWQAWTCRYVPVGLIEVLPPRMNHRSPGFIARDELEQLMASDQAADWVKLSEMLLGPVPKGFSFKPKHRSSEKMTSDQNAEG